MRKLNQALALALAVVGLAACQKIEAPSSPTGGGTPLNFTGVTNAIPLDHGRVIGVTQLDNSQVAILWFERPDQTITGVRVNVSTGVIWSTAITVPRS